MSDYSNQKFRLVDVGLNLRDASDTVKNGQWVQLDNIQSSQEALLETREGRSLAHDLGVSDSVHSLRRLDSGTIVAGAGEDIYRNSNAYGMGGLSGKPLSLITVKPYISSENWMYVADSNKMRKVHSDGSNYKWGITGPANVATFNASSEAGDLDSSVAGAIVYDWRYTYYSSATGAESNPSPVADGIACAGYKGLVTVRASSDPQVDTIKIYRRGGTQTVTWRLSVTTSNTTGEVTDNNADSVIALADALRDDNDVPFTTVDSSGNTVREQPLPYVWGPFLGKHLFACGDPYRPGFVYWTNEENPDGASPANNIQVTSPTEKLQNGCVYNGTPFVFSTSNLYVLDYGTGGGGVEFSSRKTPCGRGLAAPWALAVGPAIFFLSQDGIYASNGSQAESITEENIRPLFNGKTVGVYKPVDFNNPEYLRLIFDRQSLHFFYKDTSGQLQHLIFDVLYKRWKRSTATPRMRTGYADENQASTNFYLGGSDGDVYLKTGTTDAGTTISSVVKTGDNSMERPQTKKEWGNIIVDANPNGNTITITPYYDRVAGSPLHISGSSRAKYPLSLSDVYSHEIAFKLEWSGVVTIYQMELLWRMDEEELTHWEFPPTDHGMQGWQHVRDAYITLRSNGAVTLTQEIDGTTHTYSLTSTSGDKSKVYVKLGPYKGKLYRWKLDSPSSFRLYGEECEIRTKPWNSKLGYGKANPFMPSQGGT